MPTTASAKPRKTRTIKATTAAKKANRRTRDTPTTARVDASRLDTDGVLVVSTGHVAAGWSRVFALEVGVPLAARVLVGQPDRLLANLLAVTCA